MIKVADFGLTEDVYSQNYFRQAVKGHPNNTDASPVKLPIKWMALESLHEGLFSEKTDVVSQQRTLLMTLFSYHLYTVVIWCSLLGSV